MPDTDIVTWLRSILHNDRSVELRCQEAANEIERLRKEAEQLRAERDKARREVCHLMRSDDYYEPFDGTVFEYAIHRGWDCLDSDIGDK